MPVPYFLAPNLLKLGLRLRPELSSFKPCPHWRIQSPNLATVTENGDCCRIRRVASVDRAFEHVCGQLQRRRRQLSDFFTFQFTSRLYTQLWCRIVASEALVEQVIISIEQVSQPRLKYRESVTVDDSRRQRVPAYRCSATRISFADASPSVNFTRIFIFCYNIGEQGLSEKDYQIVVDFVTDLSPKMYRSNGNWAEHCRNRLPFPSILSLDTDLSQHTVQLWYRPKSITPVSPQQVRNKLARAKVHCVCCVVSFPKFHYNDLLPTSTVKLRGNVCNGFGAKIQCFYLLTDPFVSWYYIHPSEKLKTSENCSILILLV